MSVYHGVDGTVMAVSQEFLDDTDQPMIPAAGYPKVRLLDAENDLLVMINAAASSTPGKWAANLPVPKMNLTERKEFKIQWRFKAADGSKNKVTEVALIEPAVDQRNGDIVTLFGSGDVTVRLPVSFQPGWSGTWQVFQRNTPYITRNSQLDSPGIVKHVGMDSTVVHLPIDEIPHASLEAYLVSLRVTPPAGQTRTYNYKMWAVTPQIMLGMSHLEDFLNKSRIENTIPELRYNDSDLMTYLERGLYMFNRVGYPTGFNGTNMQGILFDCWIICASLYALGAQLIAEGSLAFDFNGQGVTLNVDRTPQLEGALGRIESQISEHVVPLKRLLNAQGITAGDGSVGGTNLNNPRSAGRLGIINAATTRLPVGARNLVTRRW